MLDGTDPVAPKTVARGIVLTALAGTSFTVLHSAVTQRRVPAAHILSIGFNCSFVGLLFFGLREYVASPLLVQYLPYSAYERRRAQFGVAAPSDARLTPTTTYDLRTDRLIDSALTGFVTGAALHVTRGRVGIVHRTLTFAATCTVLQFAYNELNFRRINYIARSLDTQVKQDSQTSVSS